MKKKLLCLFAFCLILLAGAQVLAQTEPPPDLDAYVARALKEFEVPGIAIAIVKDSKVALVKGYGVRKLGEPAPVDERTLFGIASNTKAFTAAALAILVDEGKISWDDPVTKHLPGFQMYDPYVTREMTVRDLLTHRSGLGLGAGDLMFFPPTTFTREEIVARLRYIKPATSFRSKYAYDNVLYLVAGQVVAAVSGKSWDDFIKERIFAPLGMTASNTSVKDLRPGGNFVSPHQKVEGRLQPVPYMNLDNTAPAGAINSNVAEMAKWVITQLDEGAIHSGQNGGGQNGDRRLFSQRQSREMWSAQTPIAVGNPPPPLSTLRSNFSAYGLGWGLNDYRGHKIVSHSGGLAGMVSRVRMIPDMKLGIVALTNQEAGGAMEAISYHIIDHYLNAPATDWISAFRSVSEQQLAQAKEMEKMQNVARNAESKPSLPLAKYAGQYNDAWYGEVTIALEDAKLVLRFSHTPGLVGDLEHWQYDTFVARWRDRSLNADAFVTFALKPGGGIDQMKMVPVSPLTDFSFDFQDLLFTPVPSNAPGK
ncbi:MAG TPA: serine hydrolase [Blastocatellia bacterium]|jgi:CubicO group peptidase (beta-lactamase class C family)|nr:serine hydrolase [Blastocatellia bacterium]